MPKLKSVLGPALVFITHGHQTPSHSKFKAWCALVLPLRNEEREEIPESAHLATNRDSSNKQLSFHFYGPDPSP